ncbi:unnamed protein product, partial [Staurois parvus]
FKFSLHVIGHSLQMKLYLIYYTLEQLQSAHECNGSRGGLTTHGAPGNRGSWGPCVLAHTQKNL